METTIFAWLNQVELWFSKIERDVIANQLLRATSAIMPHPDFFGASLGFMQRTQALPHSPAGRAIPAMSEILCSTSSRNLRCVSATRA
jgi:hypothetical protein